MKKIFFLAIVIFSLIALTTIAQTNVTGGTVSGTWTLAHSPYNIQGSIQIPNDSTLTIEPGVIVNFQGAYKLNVQGRLLAIGTATDTIIFKSSDTNNCWRGIRFNSTPFANDSTEIIFCKFQYSKASGSSPDDCGGALYFYNFSKAIICNCCILNCSANRYGGGICCISCSPTVSNNIFLNNSANFAGGGIYCDNSSPIIYNNLFSKNSVYPYWGGGGIYCNNYSNPSITHNTILNNMGNNGGGIYCNYSSPNISNNTISNNTAWYWGSGGGICCDNSSPTIINNIISNNTVNGFGGGGIYCSNQSNLIISNNIISNNTASSVGGGICCINCSPTISNNTISNNYSTNNGGALYCDQGSVPIFRNCILWGNTANTSGAQVFLNDEASDPNFYYCDVQGGMAAFELNGNIYSGAYQNNLNSDPKFVSPSAGSGITYNGLAANWSLQIASPCIDAGTTDTTGSNLPIVDLASNPRVTVCRIDMGAYEYQTGIPFTASLNISQPILCNGAATGEISAVATGGTAPYTYLWSSGQTTANATGLIAGTYTVTVYEASYGCALTNSITLTQPSATSVDAGIDKTIICGGIAQLDNVTSNYTGSGTLIYYWSPTTGLNSNTIPNPIATVTNNTKYFVTVTTPNGCTAVDSINVFVNSLTTNAGTDKTIICGVAVQLDSVITNYTGTGTLTYNWSPSEGLNSNTILNPIATITSNATYIVTVTTPDGCTATSSVNVYVNPLTANAGIIKTIICGGTAQLDSVTSNYTGTGTLTYNWSPSTGLSNSAIPNPTATVTSDTTYFVTVTTPNGCTAISSVTVQVNPLTISVSNTSTTCGTPVTLSTTNNYTGSGTLIYNWQPTSGLSATDVSNPLANPGSETTYSVTLTTPHGCVATNQATVILNPLPAEEICYVEFDTTTSKNSINWTTNFSANIDSVHIYNEVLTNVWSLIGSASFNQGNFIDINSNPFNQSYSYKITVKDTCGNETDSSAFHTTVTLLSAYDQGTNTYGFTWSAYQGITVSSYFIYGITSTDAETLIGTVLGNQYFYNYTNPNFAFVKYFVGFNTPTCTSKTNHLVKSNYVQATTGIAEKTGINNLVSLYPNPVTDNLQIQTALQIKNIKITDITGRLLYTTTSKIIDCSGFAKGIYFISIETGKGIVVNKFIKE